MKFGSKLCFIATAALAVGVTASATPTGRISIANLTGGGVAGSATMIDFFQPMGGGIGFFGTGGFAPAFSVTYNPTASTTATADSTTNPYGQIKDLTLAPVVVSDFIRFYPGTTLPTTGSVPQTFPTFDLVGTGPGAGVSCAGVTNSTTCSIPAASLPSGFSPVLLTYHPETDTTDVRLPLQLLARDATGSLIWVGDLTSQIAGTPAAAYTEVTTGGSIQSTWSADIHSTTATTVPEPTTMAMLGLGASLCGLFGRKFYRS